MEMIFQLAGGDPNSQEQFESFVDEYRANEQSFLSQLDALRHDSLIQAFQKKRNAKLAKLANLMENGINIAQFIHEDQKRVDAENKSRAQAEAAASLEKSRQYWQNIDAERQAGIEATKQKYSNSSSTQSSQTYGSSTNSGSVRDLYTSDPAWNRTVDQLNQKYGPEKTRQMVKEMRAQQAQSSLATQTAPSTNRDGSIPGSTVLTAITANRTLVYIQINSGSITHYATGGKNQMGEYNWKSAGRTSIQNISMTSYANQFGRDYSHAANINGVGYVFFNY